MREVVSKMRSMVISELYCLNPSYSAPLYFLPYEMLLGIVLNKDVICLYW